ncbi:AraC family transcriptional regulator [Imhoffiella purpurea]|uniref:Transcriptional regulator, AraC family n=1 Tax=Imhoffiella purpurea TaxID=1249627 RepID=W9V4X6_9GAMM|nr:helix-turn-helix transcriptional regulator [Imhoffiella purpurea]EXJ14603.1 Transcriptional regulator, AraC family [Imhoffiella purpurea]
MSPEQDWFSIDVPELETLPRAIHSRSQNLLPRQKFPLHSHRWNQFVYATSGTLVVTVGDTWHVITPEQAIWVPTGVEHTTGALNGAEFRNLYVADVPGLQMPDRCCVLAVTELLQALIIELEQVGRSEQEDRYIDQLIALILAQLERLTVQDFHLPWPRSLQLNRLCETLHANPADPRSLDDWGRELGASSRTLARRFEKELGMSLRDWRYRLRLFLAVEWLCTERSVTDIALGLGYASTSAFTYMFRQAMGRSPTEWRTQRGRTASGSSREPIDRHPS